MVSFKVVFFAQDAGLLIHKDYMERQKRSRGNPNLNLHESHWEGGKPKV